MCASAHVASQDLARLSPLVVAPTANQKKKTLMQWTTTISRSRKTEKIKA